MRITKTQKVLASTSLAALAVSCGPQLGKVEKQDAKLAQADSQASNDFVRVDVQLTEKSASGLSLTDTQASAYSMSLSGCATGFTNGGIPVTEADAAGVNLYRNDLNCILKLTTFTVSGTVYVVDVDFTTWADGDTATFMNTADNSEKIAVAITNQLGSPIVDAEVVAYSFSQIAQGSDANIADVADAVTLSVAGVPAPALEVLAIALDSEALIGAAGPAIGANGQGKFDLQMKCGVTAPTDDIVGNLCKDQDLTTMEYLMVNRSSVAGGGAPDAGDLAALFTGSQTAVTGGMVRAANTIDAGDTGGININSIAGPNQMHNNPDMMLVVRVPGNGVYSYTWFDITVTPIANQ